MKQLRPTRWYSKKQESQVAKDLKGRRVANSGATSFNKGDVVLDDWLIECKTKTRESQSITIQKEWLLKNREEAFAMNKHHSALAFDFGDGTTYYIVDSEDFREMISQENQG